MSKVKKLGRKYSRSWEDMGGNRRNVVDVLDNCTKEEPWLTGRELLDGQGGSENYSLYGLAVKWLLEGEWILEKDPNPSKRFVERRFSLSEKARARCKLESDKTIRACGLDPSSFGHD